MGRPFVDLVGKKYGRLTVVKFIGVSKKAGNYRMWHCQCQCGKERTVSFRELSRGHTRSCGCLFRETLMASGGHNRKASGVSAFNQLLLQYRRSARARGYAFTISEEEFRTLTATSCHYCGSPPAQQSPAVAGTNGGYIYTGLDRIDNRQGYIPGNVRPCCGQCNFAKGRMSEEDFLTWLRRAAHHLGL